MIFQKLDYTEDVTVIIDYINNLVDRMNQLELKISDLEGGEDNG